MAIHVINKVNSRLRFLYRQNKFLDIPLRRLLCNAMIQPFFDYACNAWYPNLNKNLKKRLQAAQNKCIRFCLKLGDRASIKSNEFALIVQQFCEIINSVLVKNLCVLVLSQFC